MWVLGLDIGYSNLKLAFGASGTAPTVVVKPAGAAPVDRLPEAFGEGEPALQVQVDGESWAAAVPPGRFSHWERALHHDYVASASYRALFHAALLLAEAATIDRLVTGLPVSHWLDTTRREALAQRLRGTHAVTARRTVEVLEVQVVPQPIGGYLDRLWARPDDDLLADGRTLVIDPGFFSVDWVLIEAGAIRKASSGTSLDAMSVVLTQASRLISEDHGGHAPMERLEEALRQQRDHIRLCGRPVELAPYLQRAAQRVAPVALEALRQSLRVEAGSVDAILLTGGGAPWFAPIAEALFPHNPVVVPETPASANARGFFWFGAD